MNQICFQLQLAVFTLFRSVVIKKAPWIMYLIKYSVWIKELHLGCGSYLIFGSINKISIFGLKKIQT